MREDKQAPRTVHNSHGKFDRRLTKIWLGQTLLSQTEFAERAGKKFSRNWLSKVLNGKIEPSAYKLKLLVEELNRWAPSYDREENLPASISAKIEGVWHSFHYTHDSHGNTTLKRGTWTIESTGYCVLEHIEPDGTRGLKYEGRAMTEGGERLLLTADNDGDGLDERLMWRVRLPSEYPPSNSAKDKRQTDGTWFGIDFQYETCFGCVFMTRDKELSESTARVELARLKQPRDFFAGPESVGGVSSDEISKIADRWSENLVGDTLRECQDGEEIWAISSYFPDFKFYDSISEFLRDRRKRIDAFLLFLDPSVKAMMKARSELMETFDETKLAKDIAFQADRFRDLGKELKDSCNIAVEYYTAWPYAHFVKIADRAMYFSLLWPSTSAVCGPMFSVKPGTSLWRHFNREFVAVWPQSNDLQPRLEAQ